MATRWADEWKLAFLMNLLFLLLGLYCLMRLFHGPTTPNNMCRAECRAELRCVLSCFSLWKSLYIETGGRVLSAQHNMQ